MKYKIGSKRIYKNDFQQFEKCNICKKGFWASSRYELGNWNEYCPICAKKEDIKLEKELIKSEEKINKLLTPEISKMIPTIDDVIREKKRKLLENLPKDTLLKIKWSSNEFLAIKVFALMHGFDCSGSKSFYFMGVHHYI